MPGTHTKLHRRNTSDIFGYRAHHNNNKMERFNGEVRDREKVMRGLERQDTKILTGYQIIHNYIRQLQGLKGKTPAEASGIKVEGKNKCIHRYRIQKPLKH